MYVHCTILCILFNYAINEELNEAQIFKTECLVSCVSSDFMREEYMYKLGFMNMNETIKVFEVRNE